MDAVPTSSRETASGDPSPLAAPLQRRGAEGPRFTFSVAARPASRTQTCLVKNHTAKVAENAAPPCRPGWPGRSPCPPGGELPPACTSVPLDRQPGHSPGPKHLAKEPESGPREAGDPQLHAGQLAPPPFSGLEPGWAREPVRSRSGRTRATPSLSGPRPLARLNPVSAAASLQAFRVPGPSPVAQGDISACPRRTRRRRHAISLHQRPPPPSRKVRLSFPHFHSHPFLLSNY